jgi:hypothetical protein
MKMSISSAQAGHGVKTNAIATEATTDFNGDIDVMIGPR